MTNAPHKVEAKRTPIKTPELWNALLLGWEPALNVNPTRAAVRLKMAHMRIECGARLENCWNYNLSNIKSVHGDGLNWHEIECGEEVELLDVPSIMSYGPPGTIVVKGQYTRDRKPMVSITVKPPHPWSRFKAFECLEDGLCAQFGYLTKNKYALRAKVLDALMTGEAKQYVTALNHAGFFTANYQTYLSGVVNCLRAIESETADYNWGDVV